jgi:hypothetical protein
MFQLLGLDSEKRVFTFEPNKVKQWNGPASFLGTVVGYNTLYLISGQWYHHAGDVLQELQFPTRPNYATFITREHARDWFLAVHIRLPEELADLRPAAFPTPVQGSEGGNSKPECLITHSQAAALVHRSKRALENYKGQGLPKPRVRGRGGKPSLWAYTEIRPWLIETFDIPLPERYFADRNAERN